jgi:predicted branched-subunit amino acid permease
MILTLPVLAYQLFFVALLYVASRFSRTALNVAAIACLLWTCTHVLFPPLAVLQAAVIVASYTTFRRRRGPALAK